MFYNINTVKRDINVVIIYWIYCFVYEGIGILMIVRKLIEFHLMGIKRIYLGSYIILF